VNPGERLFNSGRCLRTCPTCGEGQIEKVNPVWLRHVREQAGVTLRAMAKRAGVSAPYLCDIEHERRNCPQRVYVEYLKLTKRKRANGTQKGRRS